MEGAGAVQCEEEKGRGDLITLCSSLKGRCGEVGAGLCSQGISDRTRGNGFELQQGRVRLDRREKCFPGRVVREWNRLPREGVESPPLGVFKGRLDELWGDVG